VQLLTTIVTLASAVVVVADSTRTVAQVLPRVLCAISVMVRRLRSVCCLADGSACVQFQWVTTVRYFEFDAKYYVRRANGSRWLPTDARTAAAEHVAECGADAVPLPAQHRAHLCVSAVHGHCCCC
jgi:hypothetical protein